MFEKRLPSFMESMELQANIFDVFFTSFEGSFIFNKLMHGKSCPKKEGKLRFVVVGIAFEIQLQVRILHYLKLIFYK